MSDSEISSQAQSSKLSSKNARKRAQNRISQKCRRERDSAKARHLQNALAAIQSASNMNNKDQYSVLLQAYLELIDDNETLRETVLGFRKRFLSLSNAAATAAEDAIFEKLLEKGNKKVDRSMLLSRQLVDAKSYTPIADTAVTQSNVRIPDKNAGNTTLKSAGPLLFDPAMASSSDAFVGQNTGNFDNNIYALDNLTAFTQEPSIPLSYLPSFNSHEIYVYSPTEFADKVLSACRHYLNDEMKEVPAGLAHSTREIQNELLSQQVAAAAIRFLSRAAGIELYVYHTGRADYLEKIIRWRLSAIPEDGAAIPKPFAPTRLQHRQNAGAVSHHLLVDFICWPEIRDQVVLNAARLNLDELQRDMVLNTVLEAPQYGVAFYVFDVLNTRILSQYQLDYEKSSTYVRNMEWIFFKAIGQENHSDKKYDPVESAILQELKFIVRQHTTATLPELAIPDLGMSHTVNETYPTRNATWCGSSVSNDTMIANTGLGSGTANSLTVQNPSLWKLSKDFAQKYPMIDCSSGKTTRC
ncbi:heavy metal translocating p-type atpase [Fusarium oxysporum f. sp. phaseoli]